MAEAFLLALGVVLVAELGDKSQLLTLAFAARYPAWLVLLGVAIATLLMQGAAVALGAAFAMALPTTAIQIAAGIGFFVFAVWTLRDEDHDDEAAHPPVRSRVALLTVVGAVVIAEFGDKTMLVTLTLAATNDPWGTWLGASAGMFGANLLAVIAGAALGARLPRRRMRVLAAVAFVLFGALLLGEGVGLI